MRRQLVPGPVVCLTVIKAKTRPGIEASTGQTISELCREEQIGVVTKLFQKYALLYYERVHPSDYLILSLEAMVQLDRGGGTNVMYNLAKAIGTKRPITV